MKKLLLITGILLSFIVNAEIVPNNYQNHFNSAYAQYPNIPRGILEGVAFTQTHFKHINNSQPSCFGLPKVSGVMGLTENGEGYFRNNLLRVSQLSGYTVTAIKQNPSTNIMAYAKAYNFLMDSLNISSNINNHDVILKMLSEIPWDHNSANNYALNTFVFQVLDFVKNPLHQLQYGFPNQQVDLESVFGINNYQVLSSESVSINGQTVTNGNNITYEPQFKSAEYGPALWVATPSCNRSSRSGTAISAVAIHTIQGTYAGAISWAQNCSANVSYHYVERSSDGQVTQMVLEADKAWHIGSANPYTIGIEHEGYVNDPTWYTQAMYQSSADLVRDITNSGYGISPLRTFYGAATSGLNTLGACTKIKGHQHYPSQSHTDPGINWNWEKYYKLINNNPTINPLTSATGSFFDTGGAAADYSNDERELYLIQPTGATAVTITFVNFNIEQNWDYMYIYDGATTDDPLLGIYTGTSNPTTLTSSNGAMLIEFRSDCATTALGWEISWTSTISGGGGGGPTDVTAPTTLVNPVSNWYTSTFNTSFTDVDEVGGSGLKHKLYQVINYDGTEWRANSSNGFFSDNFDVSIHPDWTQQVAGWSINSGYLQCTDETESNSNIYASLEQNLNDVYLYNWSGQIGGTGTNRRAGIHFMCSDPTQTQRGNSYMVYFRADNDKIQIYESVNNSITLEQDIVFTINPNQWYDYKILYDKSTGKIDVFVDNVLAASWTDPTPITSGNSISMRSGNCVYDINNLKIYHNRANSELVTVGLNTDLPFQNTNPTTAAGRIKSIVVDSAYNVSSISFQDVNIDWTPPSNIATVNDGTSADISTFTNNNTISANWTSSSDTHSDIASYWYAIGTSPGGIDVVNWTDNWFNTSFTHSGLNLSFGVTYYVSIKSENGAGLFSTVTNSNGAILQSPTSPPVASFTVGNTTMCETDSLLMTNNSVDGISYAWSAQGASPSTSTAVNPYFSYPASGSYSVSLTVTGPGGTDSQTQNVNVIVESQPSASFNTSTNTVDIAAGNVTFTNTSQNANGYLWNFGDGGSSTDANPWHIYTTVGNYNVMCIAVNGVCANDTAFTTINVIDGSGIENQSDLNINIYPNPINNQFTIESELITNNTILEIFDTRGKVVYSTTINSKKSEISISNLAKGMYVVKITNESNVILKEIIKQ